jgi:hypothetical protein
MSTGSFPGVKSGRGVTLTPHPLLVPWSRKGRAITLLPLWAVRPVQSLSACARVNFTVRPVQSLSACARVHFTFFYVSTNVSGNLLSLKRPHTSVSLRGVTFEKCNYELLVLTYEHADVFEDQQYGHISL